MTITKDRKPCPKCGNRTMEYDNYFDRYRCMFVDCLWIETKEKQKEEERKEETKDGGFY